MRCYIFDIDGALLSADRHHFDRIALQQLISDPEVSEWIEAMNAMAMVPQKRK